MITIAKTAGFCFGVDRAVKTVYEVVKSNNNVVTLGEIIHNPDVVNSFKEMGVNVIDDYCNADKRCNVVIRSHGVGRDAYEYFEKNGIKYYDGTCPFVKRIHKIVYENSSLGRYIIIIGDENHPEIQGICGHVNGEYNVCSDEKELTEVLNSDKLTDKKISVVCQTTYNISAWKKCKEIICGLCKDADIYDTICDATDKRQTEAAKLATESDVMVIIGGKHSSNTRKLYAVCSEKCQRCFFVENAGEINMIEMLKGFSDIGDIKIGITAGASTPAYIIKEVTNQMSEQLQNMEEDFNFEEALNASFKKYNTGNRVKGVIVSVDNTGAVVDLGVKQTGFVKLDDLTDDSSLKAEDVVKVGDEVEFKVIKVNDGDGTITLSKKAVDAMVGFDKLVEAKEAGTVLEGTVVSAVKGGVIVLCNGTRVFIPGSLSGLRRDEKLESLLKKTVKFQIADVDEKKSRAVGSISAVSKAERDAAKAKFWENVNVGDVFKGEVKSIMNYGVFVDLGGIDGMVHISELSWNRISNPSEVVKVGDVIEVFVKELDKEANRISLGYKKEEDNPVVKFSNEYKVGDVTKAKIVSTTAFGAFAEIIPGIDGLIHISQLSNKRVTNVKEAVNVGDVVDVKIIEIDLEKKRISLSIRALLEDADVEEAEDAE